MSGTAPIRSADEATVIAEANIGLLYHAVRKHSRLWPNGDYEEALGLAGVAYWRCCLAFDPSAGPLSSLVDRAVFLALLHATRKIASRNREGRRQVRLTRLNAPPIDAAELPDDEPGWVRLLNDEDRLIVGMLAAGRRQRDIAAALGRARSYVAMVMGEIREALEDAGVTPDQAADRPSHLPAPRRTRHRTEVAA